MLSNRGDLGTAVAKAALCFLIGFLTWRWHLALHQWAADHLYLGPHLPYYDALLAIGTLTTCLAIWLLTQSNARRVTTNTLTMFATTIIGMLLSDPTCRGGYDHGGETVQSCLAYGIVGALVGYAWTLRSNLGPIRPPATDKAPRGPTGELPTEPPKSDDGPP
jgi:hypothetical protein